MIRLIILEFEKKILTKINEKNRDKSGRLNIEGVFSNQNMKLILSDISMLITLMKLFKVTIEVARIARGTVSNKFLSWWDKVETITISSSKPPTNTRLKIKTIMPENFKVCWIARIARIARGTVSNLHQKVLCSVKKSTVIDKKISLIIK